MSKFMSNYINNSPLFLIKLPTFSFTISSNTIIISNYCRIYSLLLISITSFTNIDSMSMFLSMFSNITFLVLKGNL